ncbi:FkbM family methyltransferase [uncultured Marinobacter sp.]|uniref:FkbM family methyltransferase n=1 Tax=uncultured Marinobacter sp. TaxID=187379 RepID=UPI0030DA8392|tara:strand:+ start:2732 stop:3478 length:747 start_codon:yes stop_codon:yes gene_type:complete
MIKLLTKKLLSLAGLQIVKTPHKGIDVCQDIMDFLPGLDIKVIFDVGANIGQSAKLYRFWFPDSGIYCFEPSKRNFRFLKDNVNTLNNVHSYNIALGAEVGVGIMSETEGLGVMDKLTKIGSVDGRAENSDLQINIETIDTFCQKESVERINYLKIDTEGHDLEVLMGASMMLKEELIDVLEVEVGMNPGNDWHVPFEKIKDFLGKFRYYPFGFYDQVHEWPENKNILRRANVVFIAEKISNRNGPGK